MRRSPLYKTINRGLILFLDVLKKSQRLRLEAAGAGQSRPAADEARTRFDLVHVDAACQAALSGNGPARGKGAPLADADAGESRAAAYHPLHQINLVFLADDGDAAVGLAARFHSPAGVVAADVAHFLL